MKPSPDFLILFSQLRIFFSLVYFFIKFNVFGLLKKSRNLKTSPWALDMFTDL